MGITRYEFEGHAFEAYPDKDGRWCQWDDVSRLIGSINQAIMDMTAILGDGPKGIQTSKVPRLFDIRDKLLESLDNREVPRE